MSNSNFISLPCSVATTSTSSGGQTFFSSIVGDSNGSDRNDTIGNRTATTARCVFKSDVYFSISKLHKDFSLPMTVARLQKDQHVSVQCHRLPMAQNDRTTQVPVQVMKTAVMMKMLKLFFYYYIIYYIILYQPKHQCMLQWTYFTRIRYLFA